MKLPSCRTGDSLARQRAYGLLNARITAHPGRGNLEFGIWGRNLTNERYFVRAFETQFLVTAIPGDPRTYGISLTYRPTTAAAITLQ